MRNEPRTDRGGQAPEAEGFLATVLNCVAEPVWVVDRDGVVLFVNPAAVAVLGYDDADQLRGRHGHDTIHYRRHDGSPYPRSECPLVATIEHGMTVRIDEDWFVRRDGTMFPVSYVSSPIELSGGRGAVLAFVDIAERWRVERAMREREAILAIVDQPVYVADNDGAIRYVNRAAMTVLGYDELSELEGRDGHWLLHYQRPDGSPFPMEECPLTVCRREGEAIAVEEDWWVRKDGSMVAIAYSATPIATPTGNGVVVAFTELEKRRALERGADARAAQRRMIEATDAARRRVARDLHDGAQQHFVNLVINLQLARHHLGDDPERARELLEAGLTQAHLGIEDLRRLASGIHPAILGSRGLRAAVAGLAERMPLPVELIAGLDGRLPATVEASAYFLVAEALTNVVKHARASHATVSLVAADGRLTVEVSDDGVGGADPACAGSGLAGLDDRLAALDGTLELFSPPDAGTTLRAQIPLSGWPADVAGVAHHRR